MARDNSNRGLGSDNMDRDTKRQIQSDGGSTNSPAQKKARRKNIKKAQDARRND